MIIVHDLDDTHNEFVVKLLEWHNSLYGTKYVFEDVRSYDLWHLWGGDRESSIKKVYAFYESKYFDEIKPITGAVDAMDVLDNHDNYVVTSRPSTLEQKTRSFTDKYFAGKFRDILITNGYSLNGHSIKKSVICDRLKADVVIEDSLLNAIECSNGDRLVLLFDKPWNRSDDNIKSMHNIVRVYSWKEAIEHIRDYEKYLDFQKMIID